MSPKLTQSIIYGTVIVAVRTPGEIIVGADSKASYAGTEYTESHCKINQVGNLFFAAAKLVGDNKDRFSVKRIASEAINKGGTISDIVTNFERLVALPLYDLSASIKNNNPDLYEGISSGGSILDILFFGIENNNPTMFYRTFNPLFPPFEPSFSGMRGQVINDDRPAYICLGHTWPLAPHITEGPEYWKKMGLVSGVRNLIQIAIKDDPSMVGGPITILRIDRKGGKWIEKSPQCPPIKKYW